MIRLSFSIFILIASTFLACSQNHDELFLNKIINDFSRNSYYIVVKVGDENKNIDYLIDNDDLFYYLHQTKGYDKATYQKYLRPILLTNKPILISKADIVKFRFIKIIQNDNVLAQTSKGEDAFIKYFFNGKILKDGISIEQRNNISQILYNWQIATRIDDETGFLILSK